MSRLARRPHDLPCLVVYPDPHEQPTLAGCSVTQLLAEPDLRDGQWVASVVRRLLAMSSGPVACALPQGPLRARLEAAGLLTITEDGSVGDAQAASWPALAELRRVAAGVGSPRPTLVLCGDRPSHADQIPFASRSGTWLFGALRTLGYDELSCYALNVSTLAGRRRTATVRALHRVLAKAAPDALWLGLGAEPQEVLRAAGVTHLAAPNPWQARRWRFAAGVEAYAAELRKAGAPLRPWQDGLPTAPTDTLPDLPAPHALRSWAYA